MPFGSPLPCEGPVEDWLQVPSPAALSDLRALPLLTFHSPLRPPRVPSLDLRRAPSSPPSPAVLFRGSWSTCARRCASGWASAFLLRSSCHVAASLRPTARSTRSRRRSSGGRQRCMLPLRSSRAATRRQSRTIWRSSSRGWRRSRRWCWASSRARCAPRLRPSSPSKCTHATSWRASSPTGSTRRRPSRGSRSSSTLPQLPFPQPALPQLTTLLATRQVPLGR